MNQSNGGFKSLILGQIDHGSTAAGERVLASTAMLRRVVDELRDDDLTRGTARYAERGVEQLERLGSYLTTSDGDRLVADAERLAHDRPWTVATTGLILGFAGSRMLKASAARRDDRSNHTTEGTYDERA